MRENGWSDITDDEDVEFNTALHQRTEELYQIPNANPNKEKLVTLPALPLRDLVVFPHMVSPVFILPGNTMQAVEFAHDHQITMIGLVQKDPDILEPTAEDFLPIGTEMAVGRLIDLPDGNSSALVQGRRRIELFDFLQMEPFIIARARVVEEPHKVDKPTDALMRTARDLFERCVQMDRTLPEEAHLFAMNINEPGWLADMIATSLALDFSERQDLLEDTHPINRLRRINHLLAEELDVLELEDEIQTQVQSEVDRSQREYYLREQMKAIQTELGDGDSWQREIQELRTKIDEAHLPGEVLAQANKEVERLTLMPSMAPEVAIIRTYLDWILDLPWERQTEDNLDVDHAAQILDQNHYGLSKAKDRILEYIAVRSLKPKRVRQPILCFIGPPGTGKTSLGKSIAGALGRNFVRLSLGGVRDEAEIRGHRRTYIGAMPGRILQTMKRAGSVNPLFMLDEIDKLGADFRGDPASALLEVLDPEQNNTFSDHYLELAYDLSRVMFVTTANSYASIPAPLLDRMEVIEFPGYVEEEKLEISHRFLLPRQEEESGLESGEFQIPDSALRRIIREYTFEAGVRNLDREIGRVYRKVARMKAQKKHYPSRITAAGVGDFLGPPEFFETEAEKKDEIGVATAMAWTESGGEIMPVEALIFGGKGSMQITGQVGDVMQESGQAALSYLKSKAEEFQIPPECFEEMDVHVHIPEGAVPKDGPSAGITLATALISAFTRRKVYKNVAMTGEITLRGNILPVGGIREKVLAAHRANIKKIILPERNIKDLEDLPRKARQELEIIPVTHMDQVLAVALHPEPNGTLKPPRSRKKTARNENNDLG